MKSAASEGLGQPDALGAGALVSGSSFTADLWVLTRCRALQLKNLVDQHLRQAPFRTLAVVGLLLLIWAALYFLLDVVLQHVRSWGVIGVVANQNLFVHFFLILAVMLAFSNALLTFGNLFGPHEAGYLLSTPVHARAVILAKWIEGMFLSSWSFLLLGVPLMLAIAANTSVAWSFYPLFLGHFVAFIAIPSCLGVLAAWAVAMWAPHRPIGVAIGLGGVLLLAIVYWFARISQEASGPEQSLGRLMSQVSMARQPLLPSTWTTHGIVASVEQRVGDSLFYLAVVALNAIFLSWLTINLLSASWPVAYSRAQQGRLRPTIRRAWLTRLVCTIGFFYLPRGMREIMLKDLRSFARDPRQWSQMLIMLGLLILYVLNIRRLPLDIANPVMKRLFTFLNLTIVGLILATFTSRFIFPLLSLEGQQIWLLELLPIRRASVLVVKFFFALTMTGVSAGTVMLLAMRALELPWDWAAVHLSLCAGICIGLSGLSVGMGARFPVLGHRNPARIASSFGGTFNLIASMLFVGIEMTGAAYLSALEIGEYTSILTPAQVRASGPILAALLAFSVAVAAVAMWIGARHFQRLET